MVIVLGLGVEYGIRVWWSKQISEIKITQPKDFKYLKYTIVNLGNRQYTGSQINIDELKVKTNKYGVYTFDFESDGKKVTGLAHIPVGCDTQNKCPVIVQYRGYADKSVYYPGYGTDHTAEKFAQEGYISLAPDFLGYGGSDPASTDAWTERFESYTTAINLLAAVDKWNYANGKVGIWGHSNGGQIALTVLEITQKNYPTVVWAPVSIYFPYSVLYYTNDNADEGVALRKEVQRLESDYNLRAFSLSDHLERIQATLFLQQGSADASVPQAWSDSLFSQLKKLNKDATYEVYPGADHNMTPGWDRAVAADIEFFGKYLK